MKTNITLDDDGLPNECPKCSSSDLIIDNVDGMECADCGCWFDVDDDGNVIWAYDNKPTESFL